MTPSSTAPDPDPLRVHGDAMARGAREDFAVNVAPGGPPPWLRAHLLAALDDVGAYPDEREATEAVARRHGRRPEEVVLVNGAAQAFWLIAHALDPRDALCVHPSFTEPEAALRAAGRPVRRLVLEPPYVLDPAAVPAAADLVVAGNPTNPTGVLHPRAALRALRRPGRTVVVDEAFMDFVPREPESLAGTPDPGLVVVRSLTKLYGLPGLRAGYVLADVPLAARLRAQRPGWSVNALALAATAACARDGEHASRVAAATTGARADLVARLRTVPGLTVHPGRANFLLAHVAGAARAAAALRAEHGIAVRTCDSFPGLGPDHLRIAVRDPAAHAELAAALTAVLEPR